VPDLREAIVMARTGNTPAKYTARPLAGVVAPRDTLLAEDPAIPVLLGRTPTVLDAFMLRRVGDVHPELIDALVDRIARGEFDHVALMNPLDEEEFWWQHYHFGLKVVRALRASYRFVGKVDGYFLYQPVRS
jgi:hypothetical protein